MDVEMKTKFMDIYYHWVPGGKKMKLIGWMTSMVVQPNATYPQPHKKKGLRN